MTELVFPAGFMWGTATAAHQVEGGNSNSDWWEWELRPGTPCKEPSGTAIDHYARYESDISMIAGLGFGTYRFSVEWARIEPTEGVFDEAQLEHYRSTVAAVRRCNLVPMVTLNHFTLPLWVAQKGSWLADETPRLFERYVRRVVEALGDSVDWYCTINEPGIVGIGGYLGMLGFPPGARGLSSWRRAADGLIAGHRRARAAVKELRPGAKVGQTHAMIEWESNAGGRPIMAFSRRIAEDVYLEASKEDDFIGVQTYTRVQLNLARPIGWLMRPVLAAGPLTRIMVSAMLSRTNLSTPPQPNPDDGVRRTQMGYEFRPQAVAATVRRVAELLPGKPIIVTEHGLATANDAERIEFISGGLAALHDVISDGIPLGGYIHWSAFDNFEWDRGYSMTFGLIGVDRATQERTVRPSARFLGEIARKNRLEVAGS